MSVITADLAIEIIVVFSAWRVSEIQSFLLIADSS